MAGFEISLGLAPLLQLATDGIREVAIRAVSALTDKQESRRNDKLIKALNIVMTEALPGETAMHSPTSYGFPELLVPHIQPHIQEVGREYTNSVLFCQTLAERNIESFYSGRLNLQESRKIVETLVRYHSDPHRSLAFISKIKIFAELFGDQPVFWEDFMIREYEPGWMPIEYEGASNLESTTVVHTVQRADHGLSLNLVSPIKAVAVRSTPDGVLVLICADGSKLVELCGCAKCSIANERHSIDWGPVFASLGRHGFPKAMHVLAMFLELQAREETTRFKWSDLASELDFATKLVELEGVRLASNRAYLSAPRPDARCDITISHSQFRTLVGNEEEEIEKVKEELSLKYVAWDIYLGRQDENVLMRSEDWEGASISKALIVLDKALASIGSLTPRDKRFKYVKDGAELLPEMRFASMLNQYNDEGELVLHRGLESSLSKKHVTVLSGEDAGCLHRFGMDAAIVYIKGGELSPMSLMSKQTFTNFVPIHPIKRQAAVVSYVSDQLNSREKKEMTAWVKGSALNILGIVDRFGDTISRCIQKRDQNSVSAIRQSVSQWAADDIGKAGLEREVLDMMLRMGFRDDGQVVGVSCFYDAVNEIEIFPRRAGATLTLDEPIRLDGLGAVETYGCTRLQHDAGVFSEWAVISDHKKKAVRIDRRGVNLNLLPETVSSVGFTVLVPTEGPRADVHLARNNPMEIGEANNLIKTDRRFIGGFHCRTATIKSLSGGK